MEAYPRALSQVTGEQARFSEWKLRKPEGGTPSTGEAWVLQPAVRGRGWRESTPHTKRSITLSLSAVKTAFSMQLSTSSEILQYRTSDRLKWLHLPRLLPYLP